MTTLIWLPRPISASKPSSDSCRVSCNTCCRFSAGISSNFFPPREWLSKRRPRIMDSSARKFFRNWRILVRAREVTTKFSQAAFGRAPGAVMISMVCPEVSGRLSGKGWRSTRAPTQLLPISVCTAYAKSTGVAPAGSSRIRPSGVNT